MIEPQLFDPMRLGVAGMVHWKGKFLVSERIGCRDMNGFWQFPGGAIEHGEAAFAAVLRETFEETGFEAENFEGDTCCIEVEPFCVGLGITPENHVFVTQFFFLDMSHYATQPMAKNKEPNKQGPWKWLDAVQLEEKNLMPLIRLALRKYILSVKLPIL